MLHSFDALPYYLSVTGVVRRLRRDFPFDLIHAHFTYPDGYVAVKLAERYQVPAIITEQAQWRPWMDNYPRVRRQAVRAAERCAFHIAISRAMRDSIVHFTGHTSNSRIIPDGIDEAVFTLPANGQTRIPNQILFVGVIRRVKGVDVLVEAMRRLLEWGRDVKLVCVGESFYGGYRVDFDAVRQLVAEYGLEDRIVFTGGQATEALVRYMQQSAVLVLPSRRESLGMVLVEALACGTPVVATRCGGPEDIVTPEVGELVEPEDPIALARGIETVLCRAREFDPARLRTHAIGHFGLDSVCHRLDALYREAIGDRASATHPA
jgi:glycosyltransferase involved in cell wall biosynthesis